MPINNLTPYNPTIKTLVSQALAEDCPSGDITTSLLGTYKQQTNAALIAKQDGIFYGAEILEEICQLSDLTYIPFPNDESKPPLVNGVRLKKGQAIATLQGEAATLLIVERTLLNFLQHLSGIATATHLITKALNDPNIKILDTRKTLPLYRDLAKKAVVAGGGHNHRYNLSDMILLKENHLNVLKNKGQLNRLTDLINEKKAANPHLKAEIEIESINELKATQFEAIDYILLDNFSIENLNVAIKWIRNHAKHCEIEVSGNVSRETIGRYKGLDIDRISVGSITHSASAFDLSLLFR